MQGSTVSHYEVLEKIGSGGMSQVYRGHDVRLDRTVALKFLSQELTDDSEARARFLREAKAASMLDHPNICTIYEIDETPDGRTFIAMAHYGGATLQARLEQGPLSIEETIDIASQISRGLSKAHAANIVHRDIKPGNVIVTEDGVAKILDFGLAKLGGAPLTRSGTILGTVAYMSPEQTMGSQVGAETDIWALGVMLYEMLVGQPPFASEHEQAMVYEIINEAPDPIRQTRDDVPAELEYIVGKALSKRPEDRYRDAAEVAVDLRKASLSLASSAPESVRLTPERQRSIAVLPFRNLSSAENEYFTEGLTEDLINALSTVPGLRVISRTSSYRFQSGVHQIREIAAKLRVAMVLEGSMRQSGRRVRINVRLVDAIDDMPVWSERFDRELQDVFEIQDEIANTVVNTLRLRLGNDREGPLASSYTQSEAAYADYLKGRFHLNRWNPQSMQKALELFARATEEDPDLALAYSGTADCLLTLGFWGLVQPLETWARARKAAQRALEIDPSNAEALTSLGTVKAVQDLDWAEAEVLILKALKLKPSYADGHFWYAVNCLNPLGRFEESIAEHRRALELDPLSANITSSLGWTYYASRDYDRAISEARSALELDPSHLQGVWCLASTFREMGRYSESRAELERAHAISPQAPINIAMFAHLAAFENKHEEADEGLAKLAQAASLTYVSPMYRAWVLAALGRRDEAFDCINEASENRDSLMRFFAVLPSLDPLRDDRRFDEIRERMGLVDGALRRRSANAAPTGQVAIPTLEE